MVYQRPSWDNSHWSGDDGKVNELTIQGELVEWHTRLPPKRGVPDKKRGNVESFTRASRLRMLSYVASIDWQKSLPGLFLTCTYTDATEITRREQLNIHRQLFWRYMEKYTGKPISALWRIEWKPRLSGGKEGHAYPHYHYLIFNYEFIPIEVIGKYWQQATCSPEIPHCFIEPIEQGQGAGIYVGKYSSKLSGSLDDVAYHNSIPGGRAWGILRKDYLIMCEKTRYVFANCKVANELRNMAAHYRKTGVILENESFKLLGWKAKEFIELFLKSELDKEEFND